MADTERGEAWSPSEQQLERLRIRHRLDRRSLLIASVASAILLGLLVLGLVSSPGWPRVRETFLSWPDAKAAFPAIAKAFWVNVRMFLVAEPVILVLGVLVATVRTTVSPALFPVRALAVFYTDLFRGVPTLLVVFLVAFGLPALQLQGVTNSLFWLGVTALVLSYGAYVAEVFRSGIESVHPSQVASAQALGLSHGQSLRYVVVPQALRRVVPPLLNDFVSLQKDTALVASVGLAEALRQAQIYSSFHFNFSSYLVAAAFFVALTIPLARLTDWLGRRFAKRERAGAR
jgi:polar amino acid transport system permease protein